jgi:hypothetical protein
MEDSLKTSAGVSACPSYSPDCCQIILRLDQQIALMPDFCRPLGVFCGSSALNAP